MAAVPQPSRQWLAIAINLPLPSPRIGVRLLHYIELSSRTNDHDRTNERGRQIETAPSLGRKRPRRHFVQATYVPVPKGPLANSKRPSRPARTECEHCQGFRIGNHSASTRFHVPLGVVPVSWLWGCAEYGVGRRDRGRSQHQALRWQTKKGPDRGGSVEGVGSGPASHQKKHQVNAAWCIWFQSSKKITSRHSVPCNQQPSLTVCDRRVRYSYMSVPLGPSPMRNFGGGVYLFTKLKFDG
jgi:hypothetical protein